MRLATALPLAGALLLGVVFPRAARPGSIGASEAEAAAFDRLVDAVGTPARPKEAQALLAHPALRDPDLARRAVGRLRHAGGAAAADALVALGSHPDAGVRAIALRAAAALALRTDAVADVRARLDDPDGKVRAAACDALGAMGEGDDVARLLAFLERESDKTLLQEAYRALVALTGVRNPYDRASWIQWWTTERDARTSRVLRAVETLRTEEDEVRLLSARRTIERDGWIVATDIRETAALWLANGDAPLRAEAYRLATGLRLGSLAGEVAGAFHFETDPDASRLGRRAVATLGISTDRSLGRR